MEILVPIIGTIIGILILCAGEYWDYSWVMKLYKAGWLNYGFDAWGNAQPNSSTPKKIWLKEGIFQEKRFFFVKLLLAVVPSIVAVLVLIFADDKLYALAPFVFNIIVGVVHFTYGANNKQKYRLIERWMAKNR